MPTVRELLDRYGRPPADVALDWAWQIRRQPSSHDPGHNPGHDPGHDANRQGCLLEVDQWTELEVSDDGQLLCDQLPITVASTALNDLRLWSASKRPSPLEQPAQLPEFTGSDRFATSKQSPETTASSITSSVSSRRRSGLKSNWAMSTKSRWVTGGCMAAFCACLVLMFIWNNSKQPAHAENDSMKLDALTTEVTEHIDAGHLDASKLPDLAAIALATPAVDAAIAANAWSDPNPTATLGQLSVASSLASTEAPNLPQNSSQAMNGELASQSDVAPEPSAGAQSSSDAVGEVERTLKKAEASEGVAIVGNGAGPSLDAPGQPWVLLRDTLRYRVTVSPKLNLSRQSQWTLAIEPIAGLAIEPEGPVPLPAQGAATWRIYEADAKPPRACLFVRAYHRGRDGTVELIFCGGSEDMPNISVPLAERWLGPLSVSLQNQAVQLRTALARLSTTVITPEQAPMVFQRKQAMLAQMIASVRLVAIMPDLTRLVELVDGQVTLHAELRAKPGEPAVATWGSVPR